MITTKKTTVGAMNTVFILLGANLGNPQGQIEKALVELEQQLGPIEAKSSLYQSEAWGLEDQPIFYNQVVRVSTTLTPKESLRVCQSIEDNLGRVRIKKWGARIIDIDILYYNNEIIDEPNLIIPHPYIAERKFTLVPLNEIAAQYVNPKLGFTNEELLLTCKDNLKVIKAEL